MTKIALCAVVAPGGARLVAFQDAMGTYQLENQYRVTVAREKEFEEVRELFEGLEREGWGEYVPGWEYALVESA